MKRGIVSSFDLIQPSKKARTEMSVEKTTVFDTELQHEDNSGQTPIHRAVIDNNLAEVRDLVLAGAELNTYDNYGLLPLEYANNSDIREFLLNSGASLPASPTQLHSLALNNNVAAINQLLDDNMSSLNALDIQGATPLHNAILMGHLDAVVALVQRGANLTQVDKTGYPPIFYADAHPSIKDFLFRSGAPEFDPTTRIDLAHNKLHDAVTHDDYTACERILAEDPSMINTTNRSNETPLMLAINNQQQSIVDLLLNHEADTEISDDNGNTPLLRAVDLGNREMVDLLLDHGADTEVTNCSQMGIIELAKKGEKHNSLSKYLKRRMGLSDESLNNIKTAFEKILENEILKANKQHKMPLIMLGELHGNYKIYQVEKVMLQVAKNYGFKTVYVEKPDLNHATFEIDRKAQNKLNMTLVPVDTHPSRNTATIDERNQYISAKISAENKPGILITGADHLKGLLQDNEAKIDTNKFYIIAINLQRLSKSPLGDSAENIFSGNPSNVIQILNERYLTSSDQVNTRWNNQPSKLKNGNLIKFPEVSQLLVMLLECLAKFFNSMIFGNRMLKPGDGKGDDFNLGNSNGPALAQGSRSKASTPSPTFGQTYTFPDMTAAKKTGITAYTPDTTSSSTVTAANKPRMR